MDALVPSIYIADLRKEMFPSTRVGYIVVPPSLRDEFLAAREALDIFSPTLYQLALTDFIREGHFARHLRRMRALYLSRRAALLEGLTAHCADHLTIYNADAGLHISTLLQDGVDDRDVVRRMLARGLSGAALSTCYAGDACQTGLLLGFGGSDETIITNATRVLGEILRQGM